MGSFGLTYNRDTVEIAYIFVRGGIDIAWKYSFLRVLTQDQCSYFTARKKLDKSFLPEC